MVDYNNQAAAMLKPCSLFTPHRHHNQRVSRIIPPRAAAAITREIVKQSLTNPSLSIALPAKADDSSLADWERVFLPIDPGVVLLDIASVPDDPKHGFLLGTSQTLLAEKHGFHVQLHRLKKKISTTDLTPFLFKEMRDEF